MAQRAEAYIVDAIRTPTGKRRGSLATVHGADLGGFILKALVDRHDIPDDEYDDVVFGCLDTIGPLAGDIARTCWLAAGLSDVVPGTTVDRQCGSSQQAVHFAAQAVMSGTMDVVVAGGVQTMSSIPISSAMVAGQHYGFNDPFSGSEGWVARYGTQLVSQFKSAQMIADKWEISREEMEAFSLESHRRARAATDAGHFEREIIPYDGLNYDETIRNTSMEAMADLEPLAPGGTITAAVSSQTCDGSSAVLVVSEEALKRYNLKPRARIAHMSVRADDPIWMLTAPIPATEHAMKKSGMSLADIDLVEINESFASVPMACLKDHGYPHEKTNVNGGAIAIGHPLGVSGARITYTLALEMKKQNKAKGIATMCVGVGQGYAVLLESV